MRVLLHAKETELTFGIPEINFVDKFSLVVLLIVVLRKAS